MLKLVTSVILVCLAATVQSQTFNQTSTGDCSPNIGSAGGDVSINCNLGPNDAQKISNAASNFFNDYLKFLNFSFSVQEDDSGYTGQIPRLPDGSIDLSEIRSAPAYGTGKTSLAQFLFSRDEVTYEYAAKIEERISER